MNTIADEHYRKIIPTLSFGNVGEGRKGEKRDLQLRGGVGL